MKNPKRSWTACSGWACTEPTGIRLAGESQPQVYTEVGSGRWSGLSLTQMSIGYEVTQTPLQILNSTMPSPTAAPSCVLNWSSGWNQTGRSSAPSPRSGEATHLLGHHPRSLPAHDARVADPEGQGTAQFIFAKSPYTVAGKTGTARIAGPNGYDGRYRASFAGYFPAEAPRYSCIVVIADTRSGVYYGSSIAGPVFRELANKVYATDPPFHESSQGLLTEAHRLPGAKDGAREELISLYTAFGLPYTGDNTSDWVTVTTGDSAAALTPAPFNHRTSRMYAAWGCAMRSTYSKTLGCRYRPKDRAPFAGKAWRRSAINRTSSITIELS